MFCKQCGKEIGEQDTFCPYCGSAQTDEKSGAQAPNNGAQYQQQQYQQYQQQQYQQQPYPQQVDSGSAGWGVLGFFIPLVGLILFLVWKDTKPRSSKSAGIGALIGVIAGVVFGIIGGIIAGAAMGAAMNGVYSQVAALTLL